MAKSLGLIGPNNPNWIGSCEDCQMPLFCGDKGFRYGDGPVTCEKCSPTYEEAKRGFESEAFDEPENYRHFRTRLANHLRSGGAMSDKYLVVL